MNANPNCQQPAPDDREELIRLLPRPAERDLPDGRHRQLQEIVMSQIDQGSAKPAAQAWKRRLVPVAAGVAAVAVVTTAVVAGRGGFGDSGAPSGVGAPAASAPVDTSSESAPAGLGGRQILLSAATLAQQAPAATGTYWYVKVVATGPTSTYVMERWTHRDGRSWLRDKKSQDRLLEAPRYGDAPFVLGGPRVSMAQLEQLPTTPDALRAWITDALDHSDVQSSGGKLVGELRERAIFGGLLSLVSLLPAPPAVRAAAFEAIAAYPNVKSLGAVDGGVGLEISIVQGSPARLVLDPATSRIRETNYYVTPDGAEFLAGEGGSFALSTEWTDQLPS